MTTEFSVETGSIAEAATLTKQCEGDISDTVAGLIQRTQSTLAEWAGPASTAYHAAITKWQSDATQILEALDGMSRSLDRSQANYDATEKAHVTGLENITYSI
jgi:WXG100 family type VII secretion target